MGVDVATALGKTSISVNAGKQGLVKQAYLETCGYKQLYNLVILLKIAGEITGDRIQNNKNRCISLTEAT